MKKLRVDEGKQNREEKFGQDGQKESVVYFAFTTESKEALGALQALRILSSMLPTALKHFSSASIDIFRLCS